MNERENVHNGHRKRMEEKVLNNVDSLLEHELLEVLLFSVLPRKDTNPISHSLLRTFGSIQNIFHADRSSLKAVKGIGETTASKLILLGKIFDKISENKQKPKKAPMFSFHNNREEILEHFRFLNEEKFIIFLLDEKYQKITTLDFIDKNRYSVTGDIPEIVNALAINNPSFALIAHNHPSGHVEPSGTDDITTIKINLMCALHKVILIDHVIVSNETAYSYHYEGRLQFIREEYNLEKLIQNIKEKENG